MSISQATKSDSTKGASVPSRSAASGRSQRFRHLLSKIDSGTVRVGIIGLGYVGLPLARAFVARGIGVLGFDVDAAKIDKLNQGQSYIGHIADEAIQQMRTQGFEATPAFGRLDEPDVIIICVPTPLTDAREPDLTYIVSSTQAIATRLRPGQLVVLESTTYPGTTRDVVLPILKSSGLEPGQDFFLAFQPRARGPRQPSVLGARRFPRSSVVWIQPAWSSRPHSMARSLSRWFPCRVPKWRKRARSSRTRIARSTSPSSMNSRCSTTAWGSMSGKSSRPPRANRLVSRRSIPGPGLGGHCIPIDPFYLTWVARKYGQATRFIELAGEINTGMPAYVVGKVADALNDRSKPIKGSKITLLGMAYKKDVDDPRESPGFELMDLLLHKGADGPVQRPSYPHAADDEALSPPEDDK